MVVDLYASQPHYLDHVAPIFLALPAEARGSVTVPWQLSQRAALLGLGPLRGEQGQPGPGRGDAPVLVAGYADHRACRWQGRETVWLGHGAGQSYGGSDEAPRMSGYPGGVGHDGTLLFMEAGERAAGRWRAFYPDVPAVAVGSPKLDARHMAGPRARARTLRGATVAFVFHWECGLLPETRSAWRHYSERMGDLVAELRCRGAQVIGHGHPRERRRWDAEWPRVGVESVAEWNDVLDRADVVCVDNCVAPDSLVLCDDLRWRQAGDLRPGDRLIACDEERSIPARMKNGRTSVREDRRLTTAVVEANELRLMDCARVITDRGSLITSWAHPWLTRRVQRYESGGKKGNWTGWRWDESAKLAAGDQVAWFVEPWLSPDSWNAGWLAGMFDGEGNLYMGSREKAAASKRGRAVRLSMAQNPGPVLEAAKASFAALGIPITERTVTGKICRKLEVSRRADILRVLGSLRPVRLLDRALTDRVWEGWTVSGNTGTATVKAIEPLGLHPVSALRTSTRTFIANGFIAHNSSAGPEAASVGIPVVWLNAPWYRCHVEHGGRFWSWTEGQPGAEGPGDVVPAIVEALSGAGDAGRAAMVADVYAACDGQAAARAAAAIFSVA